MSSQQADIIRRLQKEILPLQGYRPPTAGGANDLGLGPVVKAFPGNHFPTGAVHEFISTAAAQSAAASGFTAGLLGGLMRGGRVGVWISAARTLFPPALKAFGIPPDKLICIDLKNERDALWVMEEALKCEGLAAVVGEIRHISFTESRRLQLAVEQSRVTGFILRRQPRQLNTIACVSRWQITALPSQLEEGLPGVGFPRWQVELLKVRNGRPGAWQLEWRAGAFRPVEEIITAVAEAPQRKTG